MPQRVVVPVLTPDRVEKRQNGRRFKHDGDPAFTLTTQDRHGVLIADAADAPRILQVNRPRYNCDRVFAEGGLSPTLCTFDQPKIVRSARIRRLTPLECERLQGFPDDWTAEVSDHQRYKQCANAVTTNVVEAVIRALLPCLHDDASGKPRLGCQCHSEACATPTGCSDGEVAA